VFAKLFRQEWKESGVVFLLICCGLLAMAAVNIALISAQSVYVTVIRIILAYTGFLVGIGGLVGTFIWLLIRFQSTMFGKPGYLVRAIPVKTETQFDAKYFTGFIMLFVQIWVALACCYASALNFITAVYTTGQETSISVKDVLGISDLFGDLQFEDVVKLIYGLLIVVLAVMAVFAFGLFISAVSNTGSLQKNNILFTILFGLGGGFALEMLMLAVEGFFPVYYNLTRHRFDIGLDAYMQGSELVLQDGGYVVPTQLSFSFPILLLGLGLLFYFVGRRLTSRKCGVK